MRTILRWLKARIVSLTLVAIVLSVLAVLVLVWRPPTASVLLSDEAWTCSMHPHVRVRAPGQCPICGMDLIPLSQLAAAQERITIQAGVETEQVEFRELAKVIRTVGKFDYNERRVAYLTARVDGRVDRVFADFTGITVRQNDHLVDIYSPDLYSAQAELLLALQSYERATGDRRTAQSGLEAARTRLRLLGILPEQIAEIERTRQVTSHLRIYAPIGGVVIEKSVREQQYVSEGDMLYRIADLDPIWLYLDIYETDLAWIRPGQQVEVTVEAYPGETFHGTVIFIDPFLNDETRTVKARVNFANPDHRLKPAMYATAAIRVPLRGDGTPAPSGLEGKYVCPMHPEVAEDAPGACPICDMPLEKFPELKPVVTRLPATDPAAPEKDSVLAVRRSAVLDTGRRQVVYRKQVDGSFELVEVVLGPLAESREEARETTLYYPVLAGLHAGDEVVTHGGFLLDSQRQIEGMPSLFYPEGRAATDLHTGHGDMPRSAAPSPPVEHKH